MTWVAFYQLVLRLKARVCNLGNGYLLMIGLLGRNDWSVGSQWEVDTRVRYQVGLEFCQVHIQRSIKAQRRRDRRNDLANQAVKVGVRRSINVKIAATDVVDGLVVDHKGAVGVLQGGVCSQDSVVGFNYGGSYLWRWIHSKLELGFLAVVNAQPLHEQRGKARAGTSTETVEDEEALKTSAGLRHSAESIKGLVDVFPTYGIVTSGIIVGSILLAGYELVGMIQLSVGAGPNFVC